MKNVFLVVLALGLSALFLTCKLFPSEVSDFETRIEIWDNVAGNSNRSKLDDMNYKKNGSLLSATANFVKAIVSDEYKDEERTVDTFTYLYEIKRGFEKETYEDQPYLIPYTVNESKGAVIVIPGGGYGYKSMDGGTGEGKDIAFTLNEKGISAFVLHYRSNPYEYPIPQLDVQRAVRYLRANASEFAFNGDNIALIGFSAGGFQIGSFINQIMGQNKFPENYSPDKIDEISDTISAAGMIYPALTFNHNVPMLFCIFNADDVRNEEKRKELLNLMHLPNHITHAEIPQLVAYGTKDGMVGMDGAQEYISALKSVGEKVTEIVADRQDHGFSQSYYMEEFVDLLNTAWGK